MDKQLRQLETLRLRGDDGQAYVVHGYEHWVRLDGMPDSPDQWQSTGVCEYKLAGGTRVLVDADGTMRIAGSGVRLAHEGQLQAS